MAKKKKFGNPLKEKAYRESLKNMFDTIIDRNGCKLLVPKNEDEAAKKWMQQVEDNMEIYGLDGSVLYREGDVVDVVDHGLWSEILIKNHNCSSDPVKSMMIMTSQIEQLKKVIHIMNFSSLDAMKKNLLPSYNGPDNACFIAKPLPDGSSLGFKFTLPNTRKIA